eukprot:9023560-Pyramimonas_sp.AAC.1
MEMVSSYKCHVLHCPESPDPAIYRAEKMTFLIWFLDEVASSSETALRKHKLVPLCMRQGIAVLGLLCTVVAGLASPLSLGVAPPSCWQSGTFRLRSSSDMSRRGAVCSY